MSDFTFYDGASAKEGSREILVDFKNKYGFIPNLFAYMAESPLVLKTYLHVMNALESSSLTKAQLQLAFLTVSQENGCDFCTTGHHGLAKMHQANPQSIEAILANGVVADESDRALVTMLKQAVEQRGWVSDEQLTAFFESGFNREQYLELMLVVSVKTLSNYVNHVTKPEPNPEIVASTQ